MITDEFGDADSIEVVATSEEAWRRSQVYISSSFLFGLLRFI